MLLVANITVRRAALAEFRRFDHAAAVIMARHGSTIERALVIDDVDDTLRELHGVRFREPLPRIAELIIALLPRRRASVVTTATWHASDGPTYVA